MQLFKLPNERSFLQIKINCSLAPSLHTNAVNWGADNISSPWRISCHFLLKTFIFLVPDNNLSQKLVVYETNYSENKYRINKINKHINIISHCGNVPMSFKHALNFYELLFYFVRFYHINLILISHYLIIMGRVVLP